ncbi:MAG: DUF1549 and DUF1553 domain-containing protein, partial [Acidobacteria bacterium]|nr:DUF1549 and DUF1553 domain-containing protein [Acidobacteriota bacterium]
MLNLDSTLHSLRRRLSTAALLLPLCLFAEVKVRIEPSQITLAGPSATQRLVITKTGEAARVIDDAVCVLTSDQPSVVAVQGTLLRAGTPGEATLTANCDGTLASAVVKVAADTHPVEVSFHRDVISIFTTKGCNSSACHGSPVGQSGFKLSLYGSDVAADYKMIVEANGGRRIDRSNPEQSLLLRKPSFQLPHGGGHLISKQADEYQTLLKWLTQGARLASDGPTIKAIELYPRERVFARVGSLQPVVVLGRLSDGTTRDMTAEVRYSVNDEAVVSSVKAESITSLGRGLTVVMARGMGKTATAQMIVVDHEHGSSSIALPAINLIDRHVFTKLQQVRLAPFPLTSDAAFVRRVFLDTIGVLPTVEETERFLRATHPDKRSQLIDHLLDRPEYVSHWLVKFEDWFRNSQYYSQGRTNGSFKRYLADMIRQDRPFDEVAREMITAVGDSTVHPAANFWHPAMDFMLKTFDANKATPTVTRLFLGQRIECAECHNHPLENLTQDDFYGMAAFFARLKVKHGYAQYRRIWYSARDGELLHPASKQPVQPTFLDGTRPQIAEDQDRRAVLADWITREQSKQFARATANRIWAEYFAAGLVEPVDDFRSTNRPTHPELLDSLADTFQQAGFRFKPLHRLILNSAVYQLSSEAPGRPGGVDPLENLLLARYAPRKLPAEVLLDSIVQVTGVPQKFSGYPLGTSPKDLVSSIGATYFLTTFGVPRRDIMEGRTQEPSLSQALHLMNSGGIREMLERPDNTLGQLLERTI